jgi:hypothetical protein
LNLITDMFILKKAHFYFLNYFNLTKHHLEKSYDFGIVHKKKYALLAILFKNAYFYISNKKFFIKQPLKPVLSSYGISKNLWCNRSWC